MTSRPASAQHLRDLARLRRVRDRIFLEYAQPLDVETLARGAHMSAGPLSHEFRYGYLITRRVERANALLRRGDLKQVTRRIRPVWWNGRQASRVCGSPRWSGS